MATYEDSRSVVRTQMGETEEFEVGVGVHQGSALSPLLFVIVMEEVTKLVRHGLPWEVLFADDLVLMAKSEEELKERMSSWKRAMESKGMKVNMSKTKCMLSAKGVGEKVQVGKWPCAVCGKGVGANSIRCEKCDRWVHARCSGIRGALSKNSLGFTCRVCKGQQVQNVEKNFEVEGAIYEKVKTFCYLGDTIEAEGGTTAATTKRIQCAWMKWRELAPVLVRNGTPRRLKGKIFRVCVRSAMLYGSETWALRAEDMRRMERADMRMIRWMCGISLLERKTREQICELVEVEPLDVVMRRRRLRWFGHLERMSEDAGVRRARDLEVVGQRGRGRPRTRWMDVVEGDMIKMGLRREEGTRLTLMEIKNRIAHGGPLRSPGNLPLNRIVVVVVANVDTFPS